MKSIYSILQLATLVLGFGIATAQADVPHPFSTRILQVQCESTHFAREFCYAGGRVLDIELEHRLSDRPCIEGLNFGRNNDQIWVDNGCRGIFRVRVQTMMPIPPSYPNIQTINLECASISHDYRECGINGTLVSQVSVAYQMSNSPCIEGYSYGVRDDGYSQRIWVDHGCRATFQMTVRF
jgi:hypothetical protein